MSKAYEQGFLDKLAMLVSPQMQKQRDDRIKKLMGEGKLDEVQKLQRKWALMR